MKSYYQTQLGKLYHGDCLELMKNIEDKSIDMILCDLPYGTTACSWDTIIPFEPLWKQYKRIIKDHGATVLFGSEPFSSYLRLSNIKWYKYDWVWNKKKCGNIFLSKYQPQKTFELISVFSKNKHSYYPIMEARNSIKTSKNYGTGESLKGNRKKESKIYTYTHKYPKAIIEISNSSQKDKKHPTQKPVGLFIYLIRTYTKENDLVLDNCMGSGTTAIACERLNRRWIGIEKEEKYCKVAKERLEKETEQLKLF